MLEHATCDWNVYHVRERGDIVWIGKVNAIYQTEALKKSARQWPELLNEVVVRPVDQDEYASK